MLISLFDGISAAEDDSYQEADSLVAAVWAAQELPDGDEVTAQARVYAREVIERYSRAGVVILRTDVDGAVHVVLKPQRIRVEAERRLRPRYWRRV